MNWNLSCPRLLELDELEPLLPKTLRIGWTGTSPSQDSWNLMNWNFSCPKHLEFDELETLLPKTLGIWWTGISPAQDTYNLMNWKLSCPRFLEFDELEPVLPKTLRICSSFNVADTQIKWYWLNILWYVMLLLCWNRPITGNQYGWELYNILPHWPFSIWDRKKTLSKLERRQPAYIHNGCWRKGKNK